MIYRSICGKSKLLISETMAEKEEQKDTEAAEIKKQEKQKEQKDTEAAEIKKQEGSPELNVFVKLFPDMKLQLELSIEDFSTKLWSKGVIQGNVYDKIFDGDYNGSAHRTRHILSQTNTRQDDPQ